MYGFADNQPPVDSGTGYGPDGVYHIGGTADLAAWLAARGVDYNPVTGEGYGPGGELVWRNGDWYNADIIAIKNPVPDNLKPKGKDNTNLWIAGGLGLLVLLLAAKR